MDQTLAALWALAENMPTWRLPSWSGQLAVELALEVALVMWIVPLLVRRERDKRERDSRHDILAALVRTTAARLQAFEKIVQYALVDGDIARAAAAYQAFEDQRTFIEQGIALSTAAIDNDFHNTVMRGLGNHQSYLRAIIRHGADRIGPEAVDFVDALPATRLYDVERQGELSLGNVAEWLRRTLHWQSDALSELEATYRKRRYPKFEIGEWPWRAELGIDANVRTAEQFADDVKKRADAAHDLVMKIVAQSE
ncbi:MAG: hypothetical protein AAFX08_10830 [Pseudomonadota bacterium]